MPTFLSVISGLLVATLLQGCSHASNKLEESLAPSGEHPPESRFRNTSCYDMESVWEQADVIFTGTPHRIALEPSGVEIPDFATVLPEFEASISAEIPDDVEFSITECNPECVTRKGTKGVVFPPRILPWYELSVRVETVWRGNLEPTELIYSSGNLMIGNKALWALKRDKAGRLVMDEPNRRDGWCQMVSGVIISKFEQELGKALYSYD